MNVKKKMRKLTDTYFFQKEKIERLKMVESINPILSHRKSIEFFRHKRTKTIDEGKKITDDFKCDTLYVCGSIPNYFERYLFINNKKSHDS